MSKAHALPTGLGIENEGLELPLEELPEWEESKIKTYPIVSQPILFNAAVLIRQCWKNPVTGSLHFQVHPCGAKELHIDPLPAGSSSEGALYPEGGVVTDLKVVRETLYAMQRPGISPQFVYAQDWKEGDLVLFHNRGLLHSVTGAFTPDQLRMFHQVSFLIDGGRELMTV
jgi:alpha-ketoglutarate-dependent taurine dioxygenase